MNLIGEYIKYKLNSKGKYQIHSPFVFDFVCNCLTIPIEKEDQHSISSLKKALKTNTQSLEIQDFGAGSKKLGTRRSVNQIFKNAASKGVYATLLYQLSKHYPTQKILELGTSLGFGTIHFALGNTSAHITTLDACFSTQEIAQENADKLELNNIQFINLEFENYIKSLQDEQFDVIFIDGHHDGDALLYYLNLLDKHSHENTLFILDDIRWSDGMFSAWNKLVADKKYHLTLDLFRMGIVLKRPQQAKEHFVIKLKGILKGML